MHYTRKGKGCTTLEKEGEHYNREVVKSLANLLKHETDIRVFWESSVHPSLTVKLVAYLFRPYWYEGFKIGMVTCFLNLNQL